MMIRMAQPPATCTLAVALLLHLLPLPVTSQRWGHSTCVEELPSNLGNPGTRIHNPHVVVQYAATDTSRLSARAVQLVLSHTLGSPTLLKLRERQSEDRLLSIANGSTDASIEEWSSELPLFDDTFRCPEGCAAERQFPHRIRDMYGRLQDHNWCAG